MSASPFTPAGERAQWEMVYDLLTPLDIGDTLTYEAIAEATDLPAGDRNRLRQPTRKAANVWGAEFHRALVPVNNVGYRVAEPLEHELIAKRQHRKGKRSLARGKTAMRNADRTKLDPEARQRFDAMENNLARQEDMIRRLDSRTAKLEQATSEGKRQLSATDARIVALEDALKRHGIAAAPEGDLTT